VCLSESMSMGLGMGPGAVVLALSSSPCVLASLGLLVGLFPRLHYRLLTLCPCVCWGFCVSLWVGGWVGGCGGVGQSTTHAMMARRPLFMTLSLLGSRCVCVRACVRERGCV